jgi:general stress protein YciG
MQRGLANVSPERRREIASLGGKSVPREHRAFSRDPELAREAGRKGGKAARGRSALTLAEIDELIVSVSRGA